jgi:RNA polymerase sigma factor (TIGR02999 family)
MTGRRRPLQVLGQRSSKCHFCEVCNRGQDKIFSNSPCDPLRIKKLSVTKAGHRRLHFQTESMNSAPQNPPSIPNPPALPGTAAELAPMVYEELRRMAAQRMAREAPGHTLQPTALVHEAWMHLGHGKFENRAHFFAAAAEAMRRILVDNARRKQSLKRGGDLKRAEWSSLDLAAQAPDEQVLAVHDALDRLAEQDPLGAELVKLRFFAGLQNQEAADLLGISRHTAKRTWAYARAWLFEELNQGR